MIQTAFNTPIERTEEVLHRASRQLETDVTVNIAVSGGTDSIVAADVICRYGPEYGIHPDNVIHVDTGASVPQSRLTAQAIAHKHDLGFYVQGYRNPQDSLAVRVLENGWPGAYAGSPATGGHGLEWANRKAKPMDALYMQFDGDQLWISGVRKLESKKRQGNVPDNAMYSDKPRRTWLSPIVGWTSEDKQSYILEHGLPVSEAYLILGFSAECVACSYDDAGLLTDLELLCPELAYALKSLAVWVYQRAKAGKIDIAPKRLCWGWEPNDPSLPEAESDTQELLGCNAGSCSTRNAPEWIRNLPPEQIIDRADVKAYWAGNEGAVMGRFA